MTYHCLVVKWV